MAENEDASGTPDPAPIAESPTVAQPVVPAEPAPAPAPAPVLKTRWRDRAWTFRAMLAVALASLVIGGIVGGGIVAAAGHDRHEHRMGPWGGRGGPMMGPGWRGPRGFHDGGPQWRWNDGQGNPNGPNLTPYGGTTPGPVAPTPSPTS